MRLLKSVVAQPGTVFDVASRFTSPRYADHYCRYLYALRDRGLIYERSDRVVVATQAGRNALSKAEGLLRNRSTDDALCMTETTFLALGPRL